MPTARRPRDHRELVGRKDRGHDHQREHGVDAVVADERREGGEGHRERGYFRLTWKVAPSATEPSSFVAVASAT
jgi:hypothetical protein